MADNKKISQFTPKETKDFNGSEEFGGFDTQGGVNDNIRTKYSDMKDDIVAAATAPTPNTKGIVYGGAEWSGTGLVFNTSVVKYSYYGFVGTIDPDTVTLDNGDSEDRFDIIAVDANNSTIVVIKGTPSPDPTYPAVGEEQIFLQPVLVKAGASTPDVTQEIVYRNNMEWTGSTAGTITGTVNFADTTDPYTGTTITRVHECSRDAIVIYTKPTGNVQYDQFTLFTMRIRLPVGVPSSVTFTLRNIQNGNNSGSAVNLRNHGLNPDAVNSWQLITVPTALFNSPWGNGISFRMVIGNVSTEMSWDLDNILFTEGEAPPPPPGPDLEGYVRQDGTTPFLAPQKGVDGDDPDDLATVGQLPSPPDLSPYVKKDGSTPFTAPQPGVDPVSDADLVTKKYLDDTLNPLCTMGDWEAVSATEANAWVSVAYGDGVWIAVASTGTNRVMRSTDAGVTWNSVTAAEANLWYSVAYGEGVWIAVAAFGTNRVMRSTDAGVTWSPIAATEDNSWISVAYGDGVWIAVASDGTNRVMRSIDAGITWNPISAAEANAWYSVAYGDGVWIAVAQDGTNRVMRSIDAGITWNPISAPEANAWKSVAYGNGVWIAVASTGTNRVMRSTDAGVTWNSVAAAEANLWYSVAYGEGVWIAVAYTGTNRVMRSTDAGVTWSPIAATEDNSWISVAYGDGVWIAVSQGGTNRVMRSVMSCPSNFVKDDGSVPFLAPQKGVDGVENDDLATVGQLPSPPDLTPYVKKDGSTPFTAEQKGHPAASDAGLITLAQLRSSLSTIIWGELNGDFNPSDNGGFQFSFGSALKGASGFGVPIPFHATVNAMYIQSLTNVTLETNIALYINSTETGFKFTIANGTNTGSTSGPPSPSLVLTAGDVVNFKILSGSGGGGAIISFELLKIA